MVRKEGDLVVIDASSDGLALHEIAHIRQSIKHNEFEFQDNMLKAHHLAGYANVNEVESYRIQYSYDNNVMPKRVNNINEINFEYLMRLTTTGGTPLYPNAKLSYNFYYGSDVDFSKLYKR